MLEADKDKENARTRRDNLNELVRAMQEYDDVGSFMEHVALVMDREEDLGDAVTLMTVHGAKGLEFDTVFLPGFEDGLFPHQRSLNEEGEKGLEEERRLAYVAITRARRLCIICYANVRRLYGQYQPTMASRFLNEIPEDALKRAAGERGSSFGNNFGNGFSGSSPWRAPVASAWDKGEAGLPFLSKARGSEEDGETEGSFGIGDRIFHQKFGYGRIKGAEGTGASLKYTIAFDKAGTKKLAASLANLQGA